MKIIFLDIDGVLNSKDWFDEVKDCKGYMEINPENVKLLKEIVIQTGAQIVLSSTWRTLGKNLDNGNQHPKYTYLLDCLKEFELQILDHTPYLSNERPKEIKKWIDEHAGKENTTFVSLDDDFPSFWYKKYGIENCLVKTSFYTGGLKREDVEKATKILNGE